MHFLKWTLLIFLIGILYCVANAQDPLYNNYNVVPGSGNGIRFWNSNLYRIAMGNGAQYNYGPVTNYSIKTSMNGTVGRGWTWGKNGQAPITALSNAGHFQTAGWIRTMNRTLYLGNVQSLKGNNNTIFTFTSNNANAVSLELRNSNNRTGYLHGSGTQFGLVDADVNWSILMEKDMYTSFLINNSEKMRIESSGDVGIGTNTPDEKLDVNGKTKTASLKVDGINATNSVNGFGNKIELTGSAAAAIVFRPGDAKEQMFGFHDNGNFYWGTGQNATKPNFYPMILGASTGHLTASGNMLANNGNIQVGLNSGINGIRIKANFPGATGGWSRGYRITNETGSENFFGMGAFGSINNGASSMSYGWIGKSRLDFHMAFNVNGNVGVGTSTPDEKFEVNGKIRTQEVIVTLDNWPDYVFENDYELTPLNELEEYIQKNKHLPNVPSASEVAENGAQLGEMNKVLLEKVEELTLYLLEQDKRLKKLEYENNKLRNSDKNQK